MGYKFDEKMESLKPSVIREILKYSSDKSVIAFSAGNPAPEAFPVDAIRAITAQILSEEPIDALQYSLTEGYTPLRDAVKADIKRRNGVGREFDELIMTSGAQQVLDLATKAFCGRGDTILCESPSFVGALNAFRSNEANLVGIPMEEDGMDLTQLESALKKTPNVKLIYIIPNFQNPSGITTSLEKRKAIYALAKQYGVCILEDNPYGELRFTDEILPSIKSFDEDGIVLYIGSFSKVLSPGLRVGYVCAHRDIIQKITVLKQTNDVHTGVLSQMIAHRFLTEYDFDAHLDKLRKIYKHKAQLMLDGIKEHFNPAVTTTTPAGGLFLWGTLPAGCDMLAFCENAVKNHKVAVVPGNAFMMSDSEPCSSFRMNYSTPTDEQIVRGVEILGKLTKEI